VSGDYAETISLQSCQFHQSTKLQYLDWSVRHLLAAPCWLLALADTGESSKQCCNKN
jgi:hypothetical protein